MKHFLILIVYTILIIPFLGCKAASPAPVVYYALSYDANGAETGEVPAAINDYPTGTAIQVLDNIGNLQKTGNQFAGWNNDQNGMGDYYLPSDDLVVTEDTILYAQWREDSSFVQTQLNAINIQTELYESVPCFLAYEGQYSLVYLESGSDVSLTEAIATGQEYDTAIHQQIIGNFGQPEDVDGNGKTILFLLDVQDGYAGTGGYVAGFFDPTHMYDSATNADSNEADMLFLDVYPSVAGSDEFYATIAHEFQHLINFSNTTLDDGNPQDLWINEGLSSGAEYVYSGEINQDRVDWFNADPIGTIADGNNFFVWNGYYELGYDPDCVLDNYATVSLFFQWLRIHAVNETAVYKDILGAGYRDYRDVTTVAAARISSEFSSWQSLLETWMIGNLLCESSGYYGYDGEITVAAPGYGTSNNYEYVFQPGEGVFSLIDSGYTGSYSPVGTSGPNMRYVGINMNTGALDHASPYYGHVCLVFNANADNGGDMETGFVANTAGGSVSVLQSRSIQVPDLPESWAVGVQITPGKGVTVEGSIGPKTTAKAGLEEMLKRKKEFLHE